MNSDPRQLGHSAALFDRLAESMSAVVFELDPDGTIGYVNAAIGPLAGYQPQELVGENWWRMLTPDECEEAAGALRERMDLGDVSRFEIVIKTKSGDLATLEISSANEYGEKGELLRVAGFGVDVTDRVRSREQNYFQASLLSQVRNAIIATDVAGRIVYWNEHATRLYQWTAEEAFGKNRFALLTPPESREHADRILDALWREFFWEGEFLSQRKDGQLLTVYSVQSALRDSRGDLAGFVSVSLDISARKQEERQRQALEEQLRQSQKLEAVGRLAGGVAHDFNNLLTVILGFSESLLAGGALSENAATQVREIAKAGERAASLTRQLVAFSRRQEISLARIDINAVVRDLELMLRRLLGADIELVLDLSQEPCAVEADAGQLSQVLMNLAANARNAMPIGGRLTIESRRLPRGAAGQPIADVAERELSAIDERSAGDRGYVMLAVHDTGCGMNEEVKSRAFEPFYTTKPLGQGAGLGLATVYGLIAQCRGHIALTSEPDKGSAFRIFLPCAAPPDGAPAEATAETPSEESPATSSNDKRSAATASAAILLVEDEPAVRDWAAGVLASCGYRVHSAADPQAALETIERLQGAVDLLVTDIVMPRMSGTALARLICKSFPGLKTLFISGHSEERALASPLEAAASAFLPKPFSAQQLSRAIRDLLGDEQALRDSDDENPTRERGRG